MNRTYLRKALWKTTKSALGFGAGVVLVVTVYVLVALQWGERAASLIAVVVLLGFGFVITVWRDYELEKIEARRADRLTDADGVDD